MLEDGVGERIVADIDEWRRSESWYHDQGIPYRRGYLLHGPPGGGKTSFIFALAGHLNYNICIMGIGDSDVTDDRLALALSNLPKQSILLLEGRSKSLLHSETLTLAGGLVPTLPVTDLNGVHGDRYRLGVRAAVVGARQPQPCDVQRPAEHARWRRVQRRAHRFHDDEPSRAP